MEENIVDIYPIGKGKRVLLWLCDAVITFMVTYLLMHAAITPLANQITGYSEVSKEGNAAITQRNMLLENTKLIFFEVPGSSSNTLNDGLSYTYKEFIKDYTRNDGNVPHDVFKTYYTVYNTSEDYYSLFKIYDEGLDYFDFNDVSKTITMKISYRDMFQPLLTKTDELSENGKKAYDTYFNKFFLTFYSHMGKSIEQNDLVYEGVSYNSLMAKINKMNSHFDTMVIVCCFISYILAFGIMDILIPMVNKHHKTVSMMMMRIEHIDIDEFKLLKRKRVALGCIYSVFMYLFPICFVSLPLFNFNYMFSVGWLIYPSFISLVLCLFSLITLLISGSNQASSDMMTRTVYIDNSTLDDIYRNKGYVI